MSADPYYEQLLKEERASNDEPRMYEGIVVNSPDPGEGLLVTLPDFDENLQYGPMPYAPRQDAEPAPGMACLVALSSAGQYWCVQYWPDSLVDPTVASGILSGHGSPSAGIGRDGSFYVNIDTNDLYGPKVGLAWGSPVNLVGPVGPQGLPGSDGADGPQGDQGIQGLSGAKGAAGILEGWHFIGDPGEPVFINSWVNYAVPYGPVKFRKDPFGRVTIAGLCTNPNPLGASGAVFTLPVGYCPDYTAMFFQLRFDNSAGEVPCRIDIESNGNVIFRSGSSFGSGYLSLDLNFISANPPTSY